MKKKLMILMLTCISLVSCKEPHEHNFSEWKVTKVATCNFDGEEQRTCECGEKETQVIAKTQHIEVVDAAVEATCSETGLTEGKHCSECGEVFVAQEVVDALGHTEVIDAAKDATCTETGLTEGKHCSVCNEVLVAQETIEAAGHSFKNPVVTTSPSTTNEGEMTSDCDNCDEKLTYKILKTPSVFLTKNTLTWLEVENATGYKLYDNDELVEDLGQSLQYVLPTNASMHSYSLQAYTDNAQYIENSEMSSKIDINISYGANLQANYGTNFDGFAANKSLNTIWENCYANFSTGKVEIEENNNNAYSKLVPLGPAEPATITKALNVAVLTQGTYTLSLDVFLSEEATGKLEFGIFNGNVWLPNDFKTVIDLSGATKGQWSTVTSTFTFNEDKVGPFANLDIAYSVSELLVEDYILIDNIQVLKDGANVDVNMNNDFEQFEISLSNKLSSTGWKQDNKGDVIYIADKLENSLVSENNNVYIKAYTSNADHTGFTVKGSDEIANAGVYKLSIKVKLGDQATSVDNIGFRFSSNIQTGIFEPFTHDVVFADLDTLSTEEWTTLEVVFENRHTLIVDFVNIDFWVFTHNDELLQDNNYVLIDDIQVCKVNYQQN